ncbi:MAG TPA: prenyltransferase/squalene oxidase repeat-containing protein [Solirubrobacteraceae bacterium]|nr:prenyltransferase/squalene oxidase repeat-containing protein [Solirubrobacteraceae bacterium]
MSWQLASFALVLFALAIAFWWYEHAQPTPKLLAVLATLAAIAALGRDAFAAIPDVKPITAIVLVSGVAFGSGPGFAVGAISALASNILLGQGPWTPWQMLGWGLVGLLGAALGRVSSRRLGPLTLALACAASAEAFNLVVDVYTWTGTGDHTLRAFGLVLGTAVVFDVTHVVASFGFGLAFGPTLLRMLMRVRSRLEVSWRAPGDAPMRPVVPGATSSLPAGLSLLALLLAVPVLAVGASTSAHAASGPTVASAQAAAATAARVGIAREVSFVASAQNSDGGFGGAAGQSSSELFSSWVALGLAAAEHDPLSVRRAGHTVLDSMRAQAASVQSAGDIERTILALHACGVSARSLPGGDLVHRLMRFRARDGSFVEQANLTAFAVLALRAAGYAAHDPIVRRAVSWLGRQQEADGGFGFAKRGGGSDVDDTAAALQALVASGARGARSVARGVSFIVSAQNLDGGFPQQEGGESNAQSTAWAVQALDAASRDVEAVTRQGSRSPLGYLESLIASNGSVRYSRTGSQTPVWVTAQALTALAGKPFPIAPVHRARRAAVAETASRGALGLGLARAFAMLGAAIGAVLAP